MVTAWYNRHTKFRGEDMTQQSQRGYTAAEVAELLDRAKGEGKKVVSMTTFFRLAKEGSIEKVLPGGRVKEALYNPEQVHDLIEHGTPSKRKKRPGGQKQKVETIAPNAQFTGTSDWIQESDLPFVWALDIELYGIENSVSPTITWTWWNKNPYACRILFNKVNRRDIWGSLSVIPMEEATIYKILRGELKEQDITANDVLSYEPGREYACYIPSVAVHPDHRQSFGILLHDVMSYWCVRYPDIRITKLFAFALHDDAGTGIRLIRKLYFAPRYDVGENAWELRLDKYNPSLTIQHFQECLQEKQAGKTKRSKSKSQIVDDGIVDALATIPAVGIVARATYETAKKEDIPACVAIDEAIFGPSQDTSVDEQVATRQGWWTQNHEAFHVLRVGDQIVGYVSTLPLPEEKILRILHEEEHPRDIKAREVKVFQPGTPLNIYIVVMGIDPTIELHRKRLLGGKLVNALTETFGELGQRGIEIRTVYARSRLDEGKRILEHTGFEQMDFSPVNGKNIYFLDMEESGSSFAKVYRSGLEEYRQSNIS